MLFRSSRGTIGSILLTLVWGFTCRFLDLLHEAISWTSVSPCGASFNSAGVKAAILRQVSAAFVALPLWRTERTSLWRPERAPLWRIRRAHDLNRKSQ